MASVRPRLSPRLLLILTFTATEDTDWDTDTVLEDTTVDTVLATTASARPRPSPRLLLILTFTATAAMGWDTDTEDTTVDTVLATTESVRPRLSPRLLPILSEEGERADQDDVPSQEDIAAVQQIFPVQVEEGGGGPGARGQRGLHGDCHGEARAAEGGEGRHQDPPL